MPISTKFRERFEAAVREELAHAEERKTEPGFRGCLTVSRESGARAIPICERLADYLSEQDDPAVRGWTVHDRDLVELVIEEGHFSRLMASHLVEDKPNRIENYLAELLNTHPTDWTLFHHTTVTLRKLARLGGTILIGRGANYITADLPNTFHIRLVGSEPRRLANLKRVHSFDRKEALEYLHRTDRARSDYVKSHLHKDIADPVAYHAVIKTDDLSDELLARMIGDLFRAWESAHVH